MSNLGSKKPDRLGLVKHRSYAAGRASYWQESAENRAG